MASANVDYQDSALRHQIAVRRYTAGLTKRVAELLERADAEIIKQLRLKLSVDGGQTVSVKRLKALQKELQIARLAALAKYQADAMDELSLMAAKEAAVEVALLGSAIPIAVSFTAVAPEKLRAIVESEPFQGRVLAKWFRKLELDDAARLEEAVRLGVALGETTDSIVKRVVGSKAAGYSDGALSITRRDAQAIVRTAVNHISNAARSEVWEANNDIVTAKIWSATLDGRTTLVCMTNDGKARATSGNKIPAGLEPVPAGNDIPAHYNCRSVWQAYINGDSLLGDRPFVTDTRTRKHREIDFREEAKRSGKSIKQVRSEWADKNIGLVPADTKYPAFFKRQSAAFQDEVLGAKRGRLFRNGGLKLEQFRDRKGNELSLKALYDRYPEAFAKSNV